MASRRLAMALNRAVPDVEGQKMLMKFFVQRGPDVQEGYSELLEDACNYRDILIEHRIGEFQASQKEKVAKTAGLVGLQVPKLYEGKD